MIKCKDCEMKHRRAKTFKPDPDIKMTKSDRQHLENTERLINLTSVLHDHIKADSSSFEATNKEIKEINADVKKLLESRSFLRGAWFAIGVFGTGLVAIVGALIAWFK